MTIVTVEPIHLHVPLDEPIPPSVARPLTKALDVHLIRVTCDDGTVAYGEAWCGDWVALEVAVELLGPVLEVDLLVDRLVPGPGQGDLLALALEVVQLVRD